MASCSGLCLDIASNIAPRDSLGKLFPIMLQLAGRFGSLPAHSIGGGGAAHLTSWQKEPSGIMGVRGESCSMEATTPLSIPGEESSSSANLLGE